MRLGLVGAGNMGLPIVQRLIERGHQLKVRDIDARREQLARAAGASTAASAADLAGGASAVIVVVVDAKQTEEVLFGAGGVVSARPLPTAVLLCPTLPPAAVEQAAQRLADLGIGCIDAPMSGGPARARAGQMSLMVACADALFERFAPLLHDMAAPVFRIGARAGDGARTKLVNNMLAAINLAGAAEALALAQRVGLEPAQTLAVIEQSSGQSWIGSDRMRRALAGDRLPRAHTSLLAKDSALALHMAQEAGAEPELAQAAAQLFARACAAGLADCDDASLLNWLGSTASAGSVR